MKLIGIVLGVLLVIYCNSAAVSIFYCGFSGNFCGQSTSDDVNPQVSTVILAFANTQKDGKVLVDDGHFPSDLVKKWQSSGKKVLISVGGESGNWDYVFQSTTNINNFISTLGSAVKKYNLDGVDLDIQSYKATPRVVANTIIELKKTLNLIGKKLLVVSPQDITVYQGTKVPTPDQSGQPFNYFVPIINLADSSIDYYQPQAYNNWYDGFAGGSFNYLKDVYLNWRNMQGLSPNTKPISGFAGVKGQKLLIGLMASSKAGGSAYYAQPAVITQLKSDLKSKNLPIHGFMIWSSHWDKDNNFAISKVCAANTLITSE